MERGRGNGEYRTGKRIRERGTGKGNRKQKQGTENREQREENREQGTEDRKQRTGNRRTGNGNGCCRILHCDRENLCGALVQQSIELYLSDFLRLFTIDTISELSTFKRSRSSVTR